MLFKTNILRAAAIFTVVAFSLQSCQEDPIEPVNNNSSNIPQQYSFDNVNYGGQTVRLLLLKDLVAKVEQAETSPVNAADLVAIYENTAGLYTDIATGKKLSDKVADAGVDAQIRAWFDSVEVLSGAGKGIILSNGTHLGEAIEKTIMGGVIYHRAVNDYLLKIASADNNTVTPGEGTKMQHNWDEAFGYFGAARDYNNYTDALIINPGERDANGDGKIDVKSEKNFFFAQTAAKRDNPTANWASDSKTDYSKAIFDAFLKGRYAIDNKDYTSRDEAVQTILVNWEKIVAASVIHYINAAKADIAGGKEMYGHWSEIKGYLNIIKYNPNKTLSDANFAQIHTLTGNTVKDVNVNDLDAAAAIIKSTYGFTAQQVQGW